jgi:hypothetical protein
MASGIPILPQPRGLAVFSCSRALGGHLRPDCTTVTLEQMADEIDSALEAVTPVTLERRLRPAQGLWGAISETREISGREAVLQALRHAAIHLGELRLIRDLAAQARKAD